MREETLETIIVLLAIVGGLAVLLAVLGLLSWATGLSGGSILLIAVVVAVVVSFFREAYRQGRAKGRH